MRLDDRLRRLEDAAAMTKDRDAARAADAAQVLAYVEGLARRFPASAAMIPLGERLAKMSPAEHCAWEMRFQEEQTPIAQLMAMYGHPMMMPESEPSTENQHAPR